MCIHALIIFTCSHAQWGPRKRACIIGQGFEDGDFVEDCVFRRPHGLMSTKSSSLCKDCLQIEDRPKSEPSKPLEPEKESQDQLDRQVETAAREDRETRFQEEKARLDEIKRVKRDALVCYEDKMADTNRSDAWIYSDNGEIKISPRRDTFKLDDTREENKSHADSAIGLGISCPGNDIQDGHESDRSNSLLAREDLSTSEPILSSTPNNDHDRGHDLTYRNKEDDPTVPPAMKKTKIPRIPRPTRSRLAIPVSKPPPRATITPSPPPKQAMKRPSTPLAGNTMTPKSTPKSRLALPVSKPAPRYTPTTGTPSKSKLPKPGFTPRKQRDSGCSFGSSVGSST